MDEADQEESGNASRRQIVTQTIAIVIRSSCDLLHTCLYTQHAIIIERSLN